MAQSSYRLNGTRYALALDSQWQQSIEEAGSLRQLLESMDIAIDNELPIRIKGSGGLAKFLSQAQQSQQPYFYKAILELSFEACQLTAELNKARLLAKELEGKLAIVSDKQNKLWQNYS